MDSHSAQALRMTMLYVALLLVALCALAGADVWAVTAERQVSATHGLFLRWLGESALVAVTVALAGVALASAGGYLISRRPLLRRRPGPGGALLVQVGPAAIVIGGLCFLLASLGLIKAWLVVLAIYIVTGLPFCLWQMKRSYDAIPLAFDEAAELDGASVGQSFTRILFPLVSRPLFVTGLFSFVLAWIEYVIAAILIRAPGILPLPVAPAAIVSAPQTLGLIVAIAAVTLFLLLSGLFPPRPRRSENRS